MSTHKRHIAHLVYRFAAGGLENVIVQLLNHLPRDRYRHTVIAMTEVDETFAQRVDSPDVEFVSLKMPKGHPYGHYPHCLQHLKSIQPDVLHSCNLAALEIQPVAWWAGIPTRVHVEHGWDVSDPDGRNWKYRLTRRALLRFPTAVGAVSQQLHDYLRPLTPQSVRLLPNGVDTHRFTPEQALDATPPVGFPFSKASQVVWGTIGRLEPIKNQALLLSAFAQALHQWPQETAHWRLALIGAGPDAPRLREQTALAGISNRVWFAGVRSDIDQLLRQLSAFVLPSLAEGTSCTLQEAMATALPILATDVGGNGDLLDNGRLGRLTPSNDVTAMAQAMMEMSTQLTPNMAARQSVDHRYGLSQTMAIYDQLFGG